ncbi:MAG TPA: hypothetical protein VJR70_11610 [Stellaceae bacterium]|nr:hypothetical protein [Stellaceae bacterium]
MQTAVVVLGAIVLFGALLGFVRSLWRKPPAGGGDTGYGAIPGESPGGTTGFGGDAGHGGH